jgi:biotin carboxyl carrier protein
MTHRQTITTTGVAAVLVLAFIASTWIRLEIRFSHPCRLFAHSEWTLLESDTDTFEGRLLDRAAGNRHLIDRYQFARGDRVRFQMASNVISGAFVEAGEEVARFDSFDCTRALAELQPRLEEAEADLLAALTGEREELIALARSELAAAEAAHARSRAEYERTQHMHTRQLVSDGAWELMEASHRQTAAEAEAARHRVRAAEAGEKEAIVAACQARCRLIRQQIDDATDRLAGNRVRCPIRGQVVTLQRDSVLVRVAAVDTLYAIAPISISRRELLSPGRPARIHAPTLSDSPLVGRVAHIDRLADTIQGMTLIWVTVAVPNPERHSLAGLKGTVEFRGEKVTLLAWLRDRFEHTMDHSLG